MRFRFSDLCFQLLALDLRLVVWRLLGFGGILSKTACNLGGTFTGLLCGNLDSVTKMGI